jgi:hypothetical protein
MNVRRFVARPIALAGRYRTPNPCCWLKRFETFPPLSPVKQFINHSEALENEKPRYARKNPNLERMYDCQGPAPRWLHV